MAQRALPAGSGNHRAPGSARGRADWQLRRRTRGRRGGGQAPQALPARAGRIGPVRAAVVAVGPLLRRPSADWPTAGRSWAAKARRAAPWEVVGADGHLG
eukprot:4134189-Prymnesium_polylepis.2